MRCNICEIVFSVDEKSLDLLDHIKSKHKEIHDLHKQSPEATVGFRIEFLHLNVLNDDGDPKTEPVIIGEVCEATTEEEVKSETTNDQKEDSNVNKPIIIKKRKRCVSETRKKSWVWKYFDRISDIIYRCSMCNSVLSIKGCNTNNMNRHVRTRHPNVYQGETAGKVLSEVDGTMIELDETFQEEICTTDLEVYDAKLQKQLNKRSWIWLYFNRISSSLAQCKLCQRNISHGGNATGNMNRHLKMIHNKTGPEDHSWIWKVFDKIDEDGYFTCKICQSRCIKGSDLNTNLSCILHHLKVDHGVVSGDQIIS